MIGRTSGVVGLTATVLIQVLLVSPCSVDGRSLSFAPPSARSRSSGADQLPGGWLDYLNFYRATACLSPLSENTAWSAGDRKHAAYIVRNDVLQHRENPDNVFFSPEGQTAAQQSLLYASSNMVDTDWWAIDTWMQSPFHAIGVLDPRLVQVGYGSYREENNNLEMGAALNVLAGINQSAAATYPVFFPGNGTTIPLSLHWGGYPSPLTSCPGYRVPCGLPLIIQIGSGNLTPVVSATSFTHNGQPLEHCVFDETTYINPDRSQQRLGRSILAARDAIVLIPRAPLSSGATYTASIAVGGHTYTWSFTIGSAAQALHNQNHPGCRQ